MVNVENSYNYEQLYPTSVTLVKKKGNKNKPTIEPNLDLLIPVR